MRKKINQAKDMGSTALKTVQPMAADAVNKVKAGVAVVQKSPETERFVKAVKGSPEAIQALSVLAFSGASAAISPIVTWAACTSDNGSCSTSMVRTFFTTAALTGGALYAAKRYIPSLFTANKEPQELPAPPSSPVSPTLSKN
ncbi:MAG: hypothetical protein Q8L78_08250 [Coxiellaceae bacterium]|nr:hypothetical protein [Coxiellaceae bacterium]